MSSSPMQWFKIGSSSQRNSGNIWWQHPSPNLQDSALKDQISKEKEQSSATYKSRSLRQSQKKAVLSQNSHAYRVNQQKNLAKLSKILVLLRQRRRYPIRHPFTRALKRPQNARKNVKLVCWTTLISSIRVALTILIPWQILKNSRIRSLWVPLLPSKPSGHTLT